MTDRAGAPWRLDGRSALVTGGSGIIGSAIARGLAEAGADVALVARRREPLVDVAEEIVAETGRRAVAVAGDVGLPASLGDVVAEATGHLGRIDILVNNTFALGGQAPLLDLEPEAFDEAWRVNVLGPFQLTRLLARQMMDGRGGSVINVLSTAAFLPLSPLGPYGITKAALWTMTRYLAEECAPRVRVNAVCPGTTSADGTVTFASWKRLLPNIPLGRIGVASETANAVVFLASDASSYTTGQNLFVDGGRVNCLTGRSDPSSSGALEPGPSQT